MAKVLKNKPKVRVLSLGTGSKPFSKVSDKLDKSVILTRKDEFMINIDSFSADYYLQNQMKYIDGEEGNYVRVQIESTYGLDSAKEKELNGMQEEGRQAFKNK